MARAAFVMDRAMRALGLDGRAFLPIIVGFGCNLPALAATRTLSDSRQRVLTGMLVPFAACSARLSVFLVLAHAFFPKYAGLVGLPHVRGFGHGHPVGRRAAAPHHVPRPRTRTVDAGASRIPMPARVAAGTFGCCCVYGASSVEPA